MTTTHIAGLDRSIHKTNVWLDELAQQFGGAEHREKAYVALRSVLHAIRDRLMPEESAHFASHFPLLVAGVYYDGYKPGRRPEKPRSKEVFLQQIEEAFGPESNVDPRMAIEAVFVLLWTHLPEGQMDHVTRTLPSGIADLLTAAAR